MKKLSLIILILLINCIEAKDLKNIETPTIIKKFQLRDIDKAEFSPNGKYLAASSYYDHRVGLNFLAGKGLDEKHFHSKYDNSARLWSMQTGKLLKTFTHKANVNSVQFSKNGKWLLTSSRDKTAILWDVETGKIIQTFKGHTDFVESAVLSPDEKYILTASYDKTACLWDLKTGKIIRIYTHKEPVYCAKFSKNGKYILTTSNKSRIWNSQTDERKIILPGHIYKKNERVWKESEETRAYLWDTATGKQLKEFYEGYGIESIEFSPNAKYVSFSYRELDNHVNHVTRLWDIKNNKSVKIFSGLYCRFSPDGKYIFTVFINDTWKVCLWNIKTGKKIKEFEGYRFDFDPNFKYLVSGHADELYFWKISSGKELKPFGNKRIFGELNNIIWDSQGKQFLTTTCFGQVLIWNLF